MSDSVKWKGSKDYWRMRAEFAYSTYLMTLHGGSVPWHRAIRSRMTTPMIGDYVLETSTFYGRLLGEGNLDGVGWLIGRLFDIDHHEQPPHQDWGSYLWELCVCTRGPTEPRHNWTNAGFIVLVDWDWMEQFRRHADRGHSMYPEFDFDPCDERTWWWVEKAKREREMIMARAAAEVMGGKQLVPPSGGRIPQPTSV